MTFGQKQCAYYKCAEIIQDCQLTQGVEALSLLITLSGITASFEDSNVTFANRITVGTNTISLCAILITSYPRLTVRHYPVGRRKAETIFCNRVTRSTNHFGKNFSEINGNSILGPDTLVRNGLDHLFNLWVAHELSVINNRSNANFCGCVTTSLNIIRNTNYTKKRPGVNSKRIASKVFTRNFVAYNDDKKVNFDKNVLNHYQEAIDFDENVLNRQLQEFRNNKINYRLKQKNTDRDTRRARNSCWGSVGNFRSYYSLRSGGITGRRGYQIKAACDLSPRALNLKTGSGWFFPLVALP